MKVFKMSDEQYEELVRNIMELHGACNFADVKQIASEENLRNIVKILNETRKDDSTNEEKEHEQGQVFDPDEAFEKDVTYGRHYAS